MATFQPGDKVTITQSGTLVWVVRQIGPRRGRRPRAGVELYEVEHRAGARVRGRVIGGGVLPATHLQPYVSRSDKANSRKRATHHHDDPHTITTTANNT